MNISSNNWNGLKEIYLNCEFIMTLKGRKGYFEIASENQPIHHFETGK